MTSKFGCFVQIRDQKYEIVLTEKYMSLISFIDIYPKIQQIVRIALNEDIDFNTHEFEIFENFSTKGLVIRVMNQLVRHKSVIRIKAKPQPVNNPSFATNQSPVVILNPPLYQPIPQQMLIVRNPTLLAIPQPNPPIVAQPQQSINFLPDYIALSKAPTNPAPNNSIQRKTSHTKAGKSSEKSSSDKRHNAYCKVCPILLDNPLNRDLIVYKMKLKLETYKKYRHLLKTVAEVCDKKYHLLSNKDWNEVIPKKMEGLGYRGFTSDEWKNSFHSFLEKYSEILRVSTTPEIACNLFPFFHIFNSFVFETKEYNFKRISELKEKLRKSLPQNTSPDKTNECPKSPVKAVITGKEKFEEMVQKLTTNEKNIKIFNSMVLEMNIGWNFKDNGDKYWKLLADRMCETDVRYKFVVTSDICKTRFYMWTRFYAMNYEKLNEKLEPKVQNIFDLFKTVHTLDLTQLFSAQSMTYKRIKEISFRKELRHYFSQYLNRIRIKKLEDKCETSVPKERSKSLIGIKVTVNKSATNNRQINKNSPKIRKEVLNHKSVRNELNFIGLSQSSETDMKRAINRAKHILSKQSVKRTANKNCRKDVNKVVIPQEIETITLD